jgi:hypothetical protein
MGPKGDGKEKSKVEERGGLKARKKEKGKRRKSKEGGIEIEG